MREKGTGEEEELSLFERKMAERWQRDSERARERAETRGERKERGRARGRRGGRGKERSHEEHLRLNFVCF